MPTCTDPAGTEHDSSSWRSGSRRAAIASNTLQFVLCTTGDTCSDATPGRCSSWHCSSTRPWWGWSASCAVTYTLPPPFPARPLARPPPCRRAAHRRSDCGFGRPVQGTGSGWITTPELRWRRRATARGHWTSRWSTCTAGRAGESCRLAPDETVIFLTSPLHSY